jgi:hypothetical protein
MLPSHSAANTPLQPPLFRATATPTPPPSPSAFAAGVVLTAADGGGGWGHAQPPLKRENSQKDNDGVKEAPTLTYADVC